MLKGLWGGWILLSCVGAVMASQPPELLGIRVEKGHIVGISQQQVVQVDPGSEVTLVLFGEALEQVELVEFSQSPSNCSQTPAPDPVPRADFLSLPPIASNNNLIRLSLAKGFPDVQATFHLCFEWSSGNVSSKVGPFLNPVTMVESKARTHPPRKYIFPLPLQVILIGCLLLLSGLFSGLNLGLMALDPTELELIRKSGTKREKHYADIILPVRKTGNYLLCSLLLGNVIVNSAIAILFDDLTSGMVALLVSTFGIVIFGEIVPQSVCNKKGLAVGARTIWITKFFMVITGPLSWPIGKLLDCVLGAEAGRVYDKDRLVELIRLSCLNQEDLANADEFRIVSGALEITTKTVKEVMTNIEDVFMLDTEATLNVKLIADVVQNGYTRIPVYDDNRNNVVALLNVKDLALLDPDDNLTVKTVVGYWHHPLRFVMEDTPLKLMLEEFKKGHYHLALVQTIENPDDKDPYYNLVGIVTLEDVIEEIIQAEIMDETDVITDNVQKKKRKDVQVKDLSRILETEATTEGMVSMQLQLAAVQWLSTNLLPTSEEYITKAVLHRLAKRNCRLERPNQIGFDETTSQRRLYRKGEPSDRFILVLEGRVEVMIGAGDLIFEAGPFHCFGKEVLEQMLELAPKLTAQQISMGSVKKELGSKMYVPDFTAIVRQDVTYLEVTATTYLNAYRSSLIEMGKAVAQGSNSRYLRSSASLNPHWQTVV